MWGHERPSVNTGVKNLQRVTYKTLKNQPKPKNERRYFVYVNSELFFEELDAAKNNLLLTLSK